MIYCLPTGSSVFGQETQILLQNRHTAKFALSSHKHEGNKRQPSPLWRAFRLWKHYITLSGSKRRFRGRFIPDYHKFTYIYIYLHIATYCISMHYIFHWLRLSCFHSANLSAVLILPARKSPAQSPSGGPSYT